MTTRRARSSLAAASGSCSNYRSEIFATSDRQREVAAETVADVDASGHWPGKIVTKISEAGPFREAAAEDQDYFQRYHADDTSTSSGG